MGPKPFALALLAAASGVLPCSARAQQGHVLRPADLPPAFRDRLAHGQVARVSPAGVDSVQVASHVLLRPGEVLAARTGEPPKAAAATAGATLRLPFTYIGWDRAGAASMVYRPVWVSEGPLRYRPGADDFSGTFLLGLQDSVHPSASQPLGHPVQIRFGGDADSVAPDSVSLGTTNSQMERVRVVARAALDSVRVLVVPTFDPQGVGVWIPIQPALAFEQPPSGIQGLGVEGTTLVVGVRGARPRDSVPVTLSISRGSLETNRIFLQDGSGVVKIRSAGLGPAVVSARAPGWPPAQATIAYHWPLVFLTAALLGGVLGALGAYVNAKRRVRSMLARYVTRGVVVGLVVCVVYFGIGINLLQFKIDVRFFNEIAVFALAALAAMFGIPALPGAAKSGGGGT